MSEVRHISKAERAPSPQKDEIARVHFDERMVMIRHLVGSADKEEAEYFFRALVEQVRYLSRRHGLNFNR